MNDATQTTEPILTAGVFAALAARIAAVAAQWSADALMPLREFDALVPLDTAERFAAEIRARLDRILEYARAK